MTFFELRRLPLRVVVVAALCAAVAGCDGDSMGDVHGFDAGDGAVHFDAMPSDMPRVDGAMDAGDVDMCGPAGCVPVGSCTVVGSVVTLDTGGRPTPESVYAASSATGHLVAFHGLRGAGLNVAVRPISRDGVAGAESPTTSTLLFARNPAIAIGMTVFETNDPPPSHLVAQAIDASGVIVGDPKMLTDGMTETPHGANIVPLSGTEYLVSWLSMPMIGVTRAMVARVGVDGTLAGSATPIAAPGTGTITSATLAVGPGYLPALVTVEQDDAAMRSVRVRPIAADGTPGSPVDVVVDRTVSGGATGVRTDSGTLVAWGENVGGFRDEIHVRWVADAGTQMAERLATVGEESGTDPHLAIVPAGIVLAYRGGTTTDRGVRATGITDFGALIAPAVTLLDGAADPSTLTLSAIDATGVLVGVADVGPSGSRVRAVAANCGGL